MKKIKLLALGLCMILVLGGCSKKNAATIPEETVIPGFGVSESEVNMFMDLDAKDIEGNAFTAKDFEKYKLTMIHVWATWCTSSVDEMPALQKIAEEYQSKYNFNMVGLLMASQAKDGSVEEETLKEAKKMIKKKKIKYTQLVSYPTLQGRAIMEISAMPYIYFVDKTGKVIDVVSGSRNEEDWKRKINEVLSKVK